MNYTKVQIDTLKALMEDPLSVTYHVDAITEEVALMSNRLVVYIVPGNKLQLTLIEAQSNFTLEKLLAAGEKAEDMTQLMPTDEYRKAGKVRRYLFDGDKARPVYIQTQLLANFVDPVLYQPEYNPKHTVYVHEIDVYGKSKLAGAVMPFNIKEE